MRTSFFPNNEAKRLEKRTPMLEAYGLGKLCDLEIHRGQPKLDLGIS